jgi:multiple sugar transport system permease protein
MKLSRQQKKYLVAYSFIAPNFIGYFFFTLIPVVISLLLSFFNWNGASGSISFNGLANYLRMTQNDTFRISLLNTVYYAVFSVPFTMVCSLTLALFLNQPIKGRAFFRSVFFFPHVASVVAIAVVWNMLFNPDMGPVNQLLHRLGVEDTPRWAASTTWVMPTIVMASIWRGMGYYMVIYLAALQSIPKELYESSKMDGASFWRSFIHITIPMLTPTTFFVSIMLTISCFKVFDLIWMMTQGGPGRSSSVLVLHIYKSAFLEYRFGYASAVAVVLFLLALCITLIQFRTERKWVNYM